MGRSLPDGHNKDVIIRISKDELGHYGFFKERTGRDVDPNRLKILKYTLISWIFGLTFGIKLMEGGEERAQVAYKEIAKSVPEMETIIADESTHEKELLHLLDEERLRYVGSIVLGLNDALVELTGALAGFTLALQNTRLVAVTGLITGIAASLSMAASEYLSEKSEEGSKSPLKASIYTGSAYVFTVLFLIFPYLVLPNVYHALVWTIINAILVILFFTYYISVAKDLSFRRRFTEMACISLGVTALTFVVGYLVRTFFEVEI